MRQSIENFIHRKVVVLHDDDPSLKAAKAMKAQGVGCVVVSDSQSHVVGMVTDRDLTCRLLAEELSELTPLRDVMSSEVVTVTENSDLEEVIEKMAKFGVRRVPVLRETRTGHHHCVGIVALDDLLAADAIDSYSLKRIVSAQLKRRAGHGRRVSEAELAGTSREFVTQLSRHLNCDQERCRELCAGFFAGLARRLNYSAAVQFVIRLPYGFQAEILQMEPGPDREVTAQYLSEDAADILGTTPIQAREELRKIWDFLNRFMGSNELQHVTNQLPADITQMLVGPTPTGSVEIDESRT